MNKLIILIITIIAAFSLSACNTMEGLGRDVKNAGQSLENSARQNGY